MYAMGFIMKRFIINSKQVKLNAIAAVKQIMGADGMEVIIRPHKEDKTGEQRGWWHAMLKMIGDETGYTTEEVKELVKKSILGTKQITIGGKSMEVTESSEQLDKMGYSELIDATYRLAAEAGIVLPNPRYNGG